MDNHNRYVLLCAQTIWSGSWLDALDVFAFTSESCIVK